MPSQRPVWTPLVLETLVKAVKAGEDVSPEDYQGAALDVELALRFVGVKHKQVLVAGSISPWVESIVTALGDRDTRILVSDYQTPENSVPHIRTIDTPDLLRGIYAANSTADAYRMQHDVVISYSSVEHDGLGRYNDPLNPSGDFAAMRELYDMTRPGGYLLVAVPAWYKDMVRTCRADRRYRG